MTYLSNYFSIHPWRLLDTYDALASVFLVLFLLIRRVDPRYRTAYIGIFTTVTICVGVPLCVVALAVALK
jgi:hypothetical protein